MHINNSFRLEPHLKVSIRFQKSHAYCKQITVTVSCIKNVANYFCTSKLNINMFRFRCTIVMSAGQLKPHSIKTIRISLRFMHSWLLLFPTVPDTLDLSYTDYCNGCMKFVLFLTLCLVPFCLCFPISYYKHPLMDLLGFNSKDFWHVIGG